MADAIELTRRYDDAFNAQDAETRTAIASPDIELVMPGDMTLHGPEQVMNVVRAFWEALPDGKIVRDDDFAAGDAVVTEGKLTGGRSTAPAVKSRRAGRRSRCATRR